MLPLPLPPIRPGRQPGDLGRQRHRQGRHLCTRRAEPQLRLAVERHPQPRRRLLPPGRGQRPVRGHRRLERRAVRHCLLRLPGPGFRLERLRVGRHAHLQPLRRADRSGRAQRRHRHERRGPDLGRDELHCHPGRDSADDFDPVRRRFLCRRLVHDRRVGRALGRGRRLGPQRDSLHDRRLRPQPDQRDRLRLGLHHLQRDHDSLPRLRPARQRGGRRPASDPDRPERAVHVGRRGKPVGLRALERVGHGLLPSGRLRLLRPDGNGHGRAVRPAEGELPERRRLRRRRRRQHAFLSARPTATRARPPSRARRRSPVTTTPTPTRRIR